MNRPLISVIIPCYNSAAAIAKALDSLAAQSFRDFEVLIVDGGSADATLTIVQQYASQLTIAKIISEKDTGVYDAMNKGIRAAAGEWLYFFSSNDTLMDAGVLQDVSAALKTDAYDFVYGDAVLTSDGSRYAGAFTLERLLLKQNICHQAIFYRSAFIARTGGYNLAYKAWADWDLNIRCFQHPDVRTFYVDRVICEFNDTEGVSRAGDRVYEKLLPFYYAAQAQKLQDRITLLQAEHRKQTEQILNSRTYRLGKRMAGLFGFFRKKQ